MKKSTIRKIVKSYLSSLLVYTWVPDTNEILEFEEEFEEEFEYQKERLIKFLLKNEREHIISPDTDVIVNFFKEKE